MSYSPLRLLFVVASLALLTTGCGEQVSESESPAKAATPIDVSQYILDEEPDGAMGVISAREETKDEQPVVLVGRIGGRENPWIEGRSAFMMIDASMQLVAPGTETSGNEVCTDDCCAGKLKDCTTLVKIVDDKGKPLAMDARELLQAKELDMIVVKGVVDRDDEEGTFVLLAEGVYVRR